MPRPQRPRIILKADDLVGEDGVAEGWHLIARFIQDAQLKASCGLIGRYLHFDNPAKTLKPPDHPFIRFLRDLAARYQCQPSTWTEGSVHWKEFRRIIEYLVGDGAEFILPYEYCNLRMAEHRG